MCRRPGGDDLPYVFSGSLIVRGTGIGEVIAIGALSKIGKIGQSLSTLETEPPRLQAETRRLVRVFGIVGKDGGYTKVVAEECIVIPTASQERITPHTEGLCAVIWHLIVSHPALKVVQTKWESVSR